MAYFRGSIRSKTLMMDTTLNVVVPYDFFGPDGSPNRYDKTLILLHGLKQNADAWPRMSSCEHFANQYGYCLIMPEVQRSFYADMANGLNYFTYLTKEVPEVARNVFRIPMDSQHLYIGGLSMGGYGALKCALTYPDMFQGVICLSAGFYMLENPALMVDSYYSKEELSGVLGGKLLTPAACDLEALLSGRNNHQPFPKVYMACGLEDGLLNNNLRMRAALEGAGIPVTYEQWPGGHTWEFWNDSLNRAMAYMNGQPIPARPAAPSGRFTGPTAPG